MFRPEILLSLLIPFMGTCLGAACVFLSRRALPPGTQKALTGFASGVMVAASVWSLLIPAMEMSAPMGRLAFLPVRAASGPARCFFCCSTASSRICTWTRKKRRGYRPAFPARR